ncbi:MAG TPA: HlyD family efflux transporter periplasmic adaptor subunit [Burkholderiaceae bacterium]
MPELFRRQAVDHQRQKFHGAIVLTRSPWRTSIAAFFVLLVLALLVFAGTQGFARKETVGGVLAPAGGVLRLVAPQAGVIVATPVPQGSRVAAGQPVVRLSAEQSSAIGPTQEAVARSLALRQGSLADELRQQGEQVRQQALSLDARIAAVQSGLAQQEREIALQRERVQLVREVAARYPDLVRSGAVSPVEAAEKQTELIDQQSRLSELERAHGASQAELATLRADRANLPLQAGRESSQMRREVQALAQAQAENESHRGMQVLAPEAGDVATLLAAPGQSVAAGQTLATLLPAGAVLEAELWVTTRAAGFVHPGTPVWLRVDAFPYARFGQLPAHVREVSRSAVNAGDLGESAGAAAASGQDVFRVIVTLDAVPADAAPAWRASLKAGMRVQASLVAERRTLLQWALEPLAALRVAAR